MISDDVGVRGVYVGSSSSGAQRVTRGEFPGGPQSVGGNNRRLTAEVRGSCNARLWGLGWVHLRDCKCVPSESPFIISTHLVLCL